MRCDKCGQEWSTGYYAVNPMGGHYQPCMRCCLADIPKAAEQDISEMREWTCRAVTEYVAKMEAVLTDEGLIEEVDDA